MSENLPGPGTTCYEIRLLSPKGKCRLFAARVASDQEAADHAKNLLLRHLDCDAAEVWRGMKLIRQL